MPLRSLLLSKGKAAEQSQWQSCPQKWLSGSKPLIFSVEVIWWVPSNKNLTLWLEPASIHHNLLWCTPWYLHANKTLRQTQIMDYAIRPWATISQCFSDINYVIIDPFLSSKPYFWIPSLSKSATSQRLKTENSGRKAHQALYMSTRLFTVLLDVCLEGNMYTYSNIYLV